VSAPRLDPVRPEGHQDEPGFFGAAGYGVLATPYSRRHPRSKRLAVLGVLGGPAVLGLVLLAVPALLAALGMLPAS
jgi:hypothetical protein